MGGWIKDKVIGFIKDKIPGPIRDALGIHSPSRVAAALGMQVPAGLAQGIEANGSVVEKAANAMANNALAGITDPTINASAAFGSSGAYANASAAGGNRSQTVTIGTVALGDRSAVQEFFKQLNQDSINVGMGLTPNQGVFAQ